MVSLLSLIRDIRAVHLGHDWVSGSDIITGTNLYSGSTQPIQDRMSVVVTLAGRSSWCPRPVLSGLRSSLHWLAGWLLLWNLLVRPESLLPLLYAADNLGLLLVHEHSVLIVLLINFHRHVGGNPVDLGAISDPHDLTIYGQNFPLSPVLNVVVSPPEHLVPGLEHRLIPPHLRLQHLLQSRITESPVELDPCLLQRVQVLQHLLGDHLLPQSGNVAVHVVRNLRVPAKHYLVWRPSRGGGGTVLDEHCPLQQCLLLVPGKVPEKSLVSGVHHRMMFLHHTTGPW